MSEIKVWGCDDLRREIFSYLRKEPKVKCFYCDLVCVWDKKIINLYFSEKYTNITPTHSCYKCYWDNLLSMCCVS